MTNKHILNSTKPTLIAIPPDQSELTFNKAKSIKQFCLNYGISVSTFYRNINSMPQLAVIGSQRRILWQDEQQWLESIYEEGGADND